MKNLKNLNVLWLLGCCCVLAGCGSINTNTQDIRVDTIKIPYEGKVLLEKSDALKEEKVLEIYEEKQEEGEIQSFKDSLIIAKQYDLGKGTLTFAKDSLTLLEDQGLTLSDKKEWKTVLEDHGKKRTLVIMSYQIAGGLISKIPTLYMTQAFLEDDNEVYVFSHSTEEKSEQKNIISAFKGLSYLE